ncbi:hypothetical protein PVAND_015003 [Polypedilum vanderplanki]|uniref:Uncharacterized protein n=1 Tax=Polypedilum vanderplanki TaxID=319348 RepID=A0A9J6BBQ7_POLVA|nr:hypothetical protein PVAND_015003 [Polypedilum vanderplanki]
MNKKDSETKSKFTLSNAQRPFCSSKNMLPLTQAPSIQSPQNPPNAPRIQSPQDSANTSRANQSQSGTFQNA